jgi:cell division protease FtsH
MAGSLISFESVGAVNANLAAKVLGDRNAREAVDRILNDAKAAVRTALDAHRHVVEALRDALIERDELVGEEITAVIESTLHPAEVDVRAEVPLPVQ